MSDNKFIYSTKFDPTEWVEGIDTAIKSNEGFKKSMQEISNSSNDVNFDKSVSELVKFQANVKNTLLAIQKDSGMSTKEIDNYVKNIAKSKGQITEFLNNLKEQIKKTNDPEALKGLQQSINLTENALKELTQETVKNSNENVSARTKLRQLRQELIAMEDAGQDNTKMYREMTIQSAKLTDQIGDQSQTIRTLASDTYKLDAGVDIVKQVAAGYQLAEGALQLFGGSTADVQQQMQKLIAVQSVMNGLQEISTFVTGQSAGALAIKAGWNGVVSATEGVLAVAIGTTTTATRAFSTALVATGIGAFVVGLGLLIAYWDDVAVALGGATDAQKAYERATEESTSAINDSYVAINNQKVIFESVKNGSLSAKDGLRQFNETIRETGYQFNNISDAEAFYNKNTANFVLAAAARARALSFVNQAAELQTKAASKKELTVLEKIKNNISLYGTDPENTAKTNKALKDIRNEANKEANQILSQAINETKLANKRESLTQTNLAQSNATRTDISSKSNTSSSRGESSSTSKVRSDSAKKQVENIYAELLGGFKKELEDINQSNLKGLELINSKAKENEAQRLKKVSDALKEGKVTKGQADKLRVSIGQITDAEIQEETKKFNEARIKALKEVDNQLEKINNDLFLAKIKNTADGYEKEISIIKNNEENVIKSIEESKNSELEKIKELKKQGYLNEEEYLNKIFILNRTYDELILMSKVSTDEEIHQASLSFLKLQSETLEDDNKLVLSYLKAEENEELLVLKESYSKKLISESKYNEEKEKTQKSFREKEKTDRVTKLREELEIQQKILDNATSQNDGKTQSEAGKKIADITTEINNILSESIEIKPPKTFMEMFFEDTKEGRNKAKAVSDLVNQSVTSAIDIIKERNQQEIDSYDKAISAQEKRVDEANKIAENGNIEYLQQEEDRLNELEVKKEAAVRKQLQFDQAIQASQILVAVAGAAAQIAQPGATVANVIAGITAVIGALATGYQLVTQNRQDIPSFFDGTDSLALGNNPKGRDTIKANLNEGERVVPTYINDQLKGIKNNDLPMLVSEGIRYKQMNISGFDENKKKSESELRLQNLENLQRENNEYLKKLAINVSLDENGFSASLQSYLENSRKGSFA